MRLQMSSRSFHDRFTMVVARILSVFRKRSTSLPPKAADIAAPAEQITEHCSPVVEVKLGARAH